MLIKKLIKTQKFLSRKSNLIVLIFFIFYNSIFSQEINNWKNSGLDSIEINKIENTNNNKNFNFLIQKLINLKKQSLNKNVNIIHIGDSHIQGEVFTNTIRNNLEGYFGIGGFGLNFPYRLANTNGNSNQKITSKNNWTSIKLTSKNGQKASGLMGYIIQTKDSVVDINYNNKNYDFDKIKFFAKNPNNILKLFSDSLNYKYFKLKDNFCEIKLDKPTNSFNIKFNSPKDSITNFYGFSIENDKISGIIYNSIGVNGAKYSDFNESPNFWEQIKNIEADGIILSMGTNEAQNNNLDFFYNELLTMVSKIKMIYPNAAIIITTPPISYYKKIRINTNVYLISQIIKKFCLENNICYWDLYCIQEEIDGTVQWKKNNLLRPDLVHYSGEGYKLQANLFINAFQKSWFGLYKD